ncbi:MAG TPA: ABC transporter permease [Desulfobacterales bacterium]|nr:ABC transporter permease [Desulfobacterales bacterium]
MKRLTLDILLGNLLVFGFTALVLLISGAPVLAAFKHIWLGSFANTAKFSQVLSVWVPLTLCSCGLLYTFRVNLWNIGIEGQVTMGAIGAMAALRIPGIESPALILTLAFLGSMFSGGVWGLLAGLLKTRGGVHEIFGGLGLNFVAQGFILWLIFGPWKRPGIASMSGTELLPRKLWLATPPGWRVATAGMVIAVAVLVLTWLLIEKSNLGLRLKAIGQNPKAALLYAIAPERYYLQSIIIAGACAGLAGFLQVTAVYHCLIPPISSGYGYLALLLVMLSGYRIILIPFLALFFASLNVGAIQLPIVLQLDSALSGVIQGCCVLSALFIIGIRQKRKNS